MSKVKVASKDYDGKLRIKNKDFYHSFESIVMNKKFTIYDVILIMLFSYIMKARNEAESELKKLCTQFASRVYTIAVTISLYFATVITNGSPKNIVIATVLFLLVNITVHLYYKNNNVVVNEVFMKKYNKIANEINLVFQ